jgi:hypothetical protein
MQKVLLFIAIMLTGGYVVAQSIPPGSCGLLYSYDAAGNRTKQEYFCNNTSAPVEMRTAVTPVTKNESETDEETGFVKTEALYPNPTTGHFVIRFARELKDVQIIITDVNGRALQQILGSGNIMDFDISNRPAGIYYVIIRQGKESITQKVIKL